MTTYPAQGQTPWDVQLQSWLNETFAAGSALTTHAALTTSAHGGIPARPWVNVVSPMIPAAFGALGGTGLANRIVACRVTIPTTGTLRDLSIYISTQNGNMMVAVYDTGDALAGSRTRLWESGSVAVPAANAWRTIGDPNLAVTAGQQLDFAVSFDGTTAAYARYLLAGAGQAQLPTSFWTAAGGALGKIQWARDPGSFTMPSTITEANCSVATTGQIPSLIARVA